MITFKIIRNKLTLYIVMTFSLLIFYTGVGVAQTKICTEPKTCDWEHFVTWAPTAGRVWLEHRVGKFYTLHSRFIWTNTDGFKKREGLDISYMPSYEQSIVLTRYSFMQCLQTEEKSWSYFTERKTVDCHPDSIIHDFPSSAGFYVDTRAVDDEEKNGRDFGFGLQYPDKLEKGIVYSVNFHLKNEKIPIRMGPFSEQYLWVEPVPWSRVRVKPSLTHHTSQDNTCLPTTSGMDLFNNKEDVKGFCEENSDSLGSPQACMFETELGCLNILSTDTANDGVAMREKDEFQKDENVSPTLAWCIFDKEGKLQDENDTLKEAKANPNFHLNIPAQTKVELYECRDIDWWLIKPTKSGQYRLSLEVPKGTDFDFFVYKEKDLIGKSPNTDSKTQKIEYSLSKWKAANKANSLADNTFTTSSGEEKDSFFDNTEEVVELSLRAGTDYYVQFVSNAVFSKGDDGDVDDTHGGWYGNFQAYFLKSSIKIGDIVISKSDDSEGVIIDSTDHEWVIFWDYKRIELNAEDKFELTEKKTTSEELRQACKGHFNIVLKELATKKNNEMLESNKEYYKAYEKICSEGLGVSYLYGKSRIKSRTSRNKTPVSFPVTRSQYVKLVSEALEVDNSDKPFRTPTQRPFNDVLVEDQFAPYIQYAKDKGIIQGCGEGNFCPDEYITKAEGIKIVIAGFKDKFAKIFNAFSNGKEPVRLFNDVTDKSAWFYPYVYTAKESHLLHGYKDNSFKPNELMSRANMAKVVCIAAFGPMECSNMGDTDRSVVFAVTPDTATVNELVTFTIEGLSMPIPVTLAIPDCANLTPVSGGTAEKQDFQCTPTLAGLKNATVNAPDGTVLVEFAVEVNDISAPPPPPSCTPSVTAVSPLTAVLNQTQVFTVKGLCLPETTVFSIAECDNLARLDGDEQQQPFRCLPNSTGDKQGVVKDQPEGTVLHDFTVSVTEDSTPTTPTPLEGDGLIHDKYRPGDATKLFILNEKMTTTCTFSDVAPSPEFAEAVNALCSAGILVGYWENDERVFVKLHPAKVQNNPNISRDDPDNLMTKAILAEILKVFLFALDYDYFGVRHVNDSDWYKLFIDEAKNRGLDLHDLAYNNQVTRGQAMTWLAQLFYDYTGSDPIALLDSKGITNGERPNDALTRYELALLTYRAILDTDKTDEIHFGLFDAPAPKLPSSNDSSFGQSVAKQALAAVGQTYPYVDSQYTYSARFVRTQFEKRAKWPDAKNLCQHYDDLGVMATSETPPAGAVICYLPGETNWDYGHVAIAIGDGTEVGVTSLTDGVTQRDIYRGTGYQGWIDAQDFENHYP